MSRYFEAIADAVGDRVDGNSQLAIAGGVTAASALVWYLFRKSSKPSFTQLGGGSLDSGKIQTEVRARPRRRALRRRWSWRTAPTAAPAPRRAADRLLPRLAARRLPRARAPLPPLTRRRRLAHTSLTHLPPPLPSPPTTPQVADYYAEFSSLKRGDGAVMAGRRKERVAELVDTF